MSDIKIRLAGDFGFFVDENGDPIDIPDDAWQKIQEEVTKEIDLQILEELREVMNVRS